LDQPSFGAVGKNIAGSSQEYDQSLDHFCYQHLLQETLLDSPLGKTLVSDQLNNRLHTLSESF